MGLSFIALLFLQLSYMNDMVQMKKEQLDENVNRALYQASRKQELDETLRCLELNLRDSLPMDVTAMTVDGVDSLVQVNDWNAKMSRMKGANKFSILHQPNATEKTKTWSFMNYCVTVMSGRKHCWMRLSIRCFTTAVTNH